MGLPIEFTEKFKRDVLPELQAELKSQKANAYDFMNGRQWQSFREAYAYYYGRLPIKQIEGQATYTDRTVEATVNAALTDLTTVFTTGDPVKFVAETNDPNETYKAEVATDAVNQIILRENDGQLILENALLEGLITGTSFIKKYWHTEYKSMRDTIPSISSDEEIQAHLMGLKAGGVDITKANITEIDQNGERQVTIDYKLQSKYTKLEFLPYEQILVEENCISLNTANYIAHRTYKTREEIVALGFDEKEIDNIISGYTDDMELSLARTERTPVLGINVSTSYDDAMPSDNMAGRILVYENYMRTSKLSEDGTVKLYQVIDINDIPFYIEEIDQLPISDITPLPMPGTLWGQSLTSLVKDVQDLRTLIKRYYLDSAKKNLYPNYIASRDIDPRELLETGTKNGVIVRVDNVSEGVSFFPTPTLPQGLSELLERSENEIATRTGVNPTQAGINSDMVHAAGEATAAMLISAAQGRMRMMARTLAHTFFKRLFRDIYDLWRNNAEVPLPVQTAYGIVRVDPGDCPPRNHILVATALSNSEKAEAAQRLQTLVAGLGAIEALQSTVVTPQNKFYMSYEYAQALGYKNALNFITPLENIPQPQPDPGMIAQMENLASTTNLNNANAMAIANKAQQELDNNVNHWQIEAGKLKLMNAAQISKDQQAATDRIIEMEKIALQREVEALKAAHTTEQQAVKEYQAQTDRLMQTNQAKINQLNNQGE